MYTDNVRVLPNLEHSVVDRTIYETWNLTLNDCNSNNDNKQ